jgi:IclR family acetate operon transcriptional repressor
MAYPSAKAVVQNSPRSLTRLLGLFELLALHADGLSLADISVFLGSPKSSLLNLLRPLVVKGYLIHGDNRYSLGPAIFQLSGHILAARHLPRFVWPFLQDLAQKTGETVFLVAMDRERRMVTYISGIESSQPVRYSVPVGSTRPLYATAGGRLLLAFQDADWLEQYLKTEKFTQFTKRTPTNADALRRVLAEIRDTQISISRGDMIEGAGGIAAPVRLPNGEVEAAILIAAPIGRFERALPKLRSVLADAIAKINGSAPPADSAGQGKSWSNQIPPKPTHQKAKSPKRAR